MSFISNSVQLYKPVGLLGQFMGGFESILSSKVTSGNEIWGNFEKYRNKQNVDPLAKCMCTPLHYAIFDTFVKEIDSGP